METDFEDTKKRPLTSKYRVCGIIILCVFLLLILSSCRKRPSPTKLPKIPPPDLSGCTRVELRYGPSTVEYFIPRVKNHDLLSPEEVQDVHSLEPIIVEDPGRIKAFAHDVSLGYYDGPSEEIAIPMKRVVHFVCYRDAERLTSFTKFGSRIKTEDKQWFKYDKGFPSLRMLTPQILTSKIRPFELRVNCGCNLGLLWSPLVMLPKEKKIYPVPSEWCDFVVKRYYRSAKELLKCPSVGKGKCHYAMNPNCEPNSPPDTVLLFETKAGWNQHGGPELFTFDNHDPKGGCVLLNDGTVKFIRTKEELQQLRWE